MDICVTCSAMQSFVDLLHTTKSSLYTYLGSEFLALLTGMTLFFLVWHLFKAMVYRRDFVWPELLEQIFTMFVVAAALSSGFFWWPVFDLIVDIGAFMGQKVGELGGLPEPTHPGLVGFVETIEKIVYMPVTKLITYVTGEITWRNLGSAVLLLLAAVFFVLLAWEMLKSVVRSYFAIQAVALIAAPLVFFYAFPDTRSITITGLKVVVVNALRLYLGMAISVVVMITFMKLGPAEIMADQLAGAARGDLEAYTKLVFTAALLWVGYGTFMSVAGEVFQVFGQSQNLSVGGLVRGMIQRIRS
jgi:hypothetical protein